ncbi:MAG: alpha-L-fucosidase [Bacteroidales bacterium]|nr:alpha-L-fucosidase [Bacteroidales bacterium]MBN2820921.1 alpha-L-fucosidase [Bacteroidales bacterium]
MKSTVLIFMFLSLTFLSGCDSDKNQKHKFQPTFESLEEANPVPEWFKDAKFGIYFHWGVYSVPAFANEWYPRNMYINGSVENKHHIATYGNIDTWPYNNFITGANDKQGNFVQFAPKLKSEGGNFDPEEWAQLFAEAGAKFAGPVAEHHDGFSMWASKVNPWNAKEMGPELDLVGLFTDAIRKNDMKVILSMHHAYNITGFYEAVPETDDPKLQILYGQLGKVKNEEIWLKKHKEIIDMYNPDIIWQDFNLHLISEPVLLEFLAYYYNQAVGWNKEVVTTFKDGLNTTCAVLDYERGGPIDITENYWLTDDAISSSSWCYTEGIEYYSKKQVLHGFIDRISKNGNLLLNLSPRADGTIPQEQKDILLYMGNWLKKYGEAIYATRAWEKYGEGPTKMGSEHGVFMAPAEGTAQDIRYTRTKDNSTLYAILYGWETGQKNITLEALSSDRMNISNLKKVELINGEAEKYLSLDYTQTSEGLVINLPAKELNEPAYVIKLNFDDNIPPLDKYVEISNKSYFNLSPGSYMNNPVLGSDMLLSQERNTFENQWKFAQVDKGIYNIHNRKNSKNVLTCQIADDNLPVLLLSDFADEENQLWKIESTYNALFTISNIQYPEYRLSVEGEFMPGNNAVINATSASTQGWRLTEVCELMQQAYTAHVIPGIVEAEDFDAGCPGDAFLDKDEINNGGRYRPNQPVDIDTCSTGTYLIGWTNAGEWLEYTVEVSKSASYEITMNLATIYDNTKFHLESDGTNITGIIDVPNTAGFQNWKEIKKDIYLKTGRHILKLYIDNGGFNIDKMIFKLKE